MKWLAFVLLGSMLWFMLSCFSASVGLADEDTATSGNILPNAATTSFLCIVFFETFIYP